MKRAFRAGLLLLALGVGCGVAQAQTCREDIRATAPSGRYTDNGDGTVTDAVTGLMWARCAEGLWGAGCTSGEAAYPDWEGALLRAADATLAGHTDWRLPNRKELASLVEQRCYAPAINAALFPNTPYFTSGNLDAFWSSTPSRAYPVTVWVVRFGYGDDTYQPKVGSGALVRLVRGGE